MSKWLLHASIYLPEVLALDWLLLLKMAISGFIGNKVCGDYAAVGNFRSDGMAFVKFDGSSNIGYFINPQGEIILICEEHEHKIYNLRRYNGNQK